MWELLAMLLCLILVGDVKGDCTELQACEDAIPRTIRNFGFTNLLRINYENLYPFCTTGLSNFTSCFNNKLESCNKSETKTDMKTAINVLEYICGAEGRRDVNRLQNSACFNNTLLQDQMGTRLSDCLQIFNYFFDYIFIGNIFRACRLVDEHLNCMVERVTDICGANTRPFAANYFEIFLTNELSEYCSQNVIQNRRMPALTTLSNQHALDSKLRRRISSSL